MVAGWPGSGILSTWILRVHSLHIMEYLSGMHLQPRDVCIEISLWDGDPGDVLSSFAVGCKYALVGATIRRDFLLTVRRQKLA